jgi:hypothetical protein
MKLYLDPLIKYFMIYIYSRKKYTVKIRKYNQFLVLNIYNYIILKSSNISINPAVLMK